MIQRGFPTYLLLFNAYVGDVVENPPLFKDRMLFQLYRAPIPISFEKKKDLLGMSECLPADKINFYDELPFLEQKKSAGKTNPTRHSNENWTRKKLKTEHTHSRIFELRASKAFLL